MSTRIYKYALDPSPMQLRELEKVGRTSRYLWNRLVKIYYRTISLIENGRRATIEMDYTRLLAEKDLVGKRVSAVNQLAKERGLPFDAALRIFVKEKSTKDTTIPISKKSKVKLKHWAAKHLSWKYSVEKVNAERDTIISSKLRPVWTGIQTKWINYGESLDKLIFQPPRFKKYGQISSIQKQITKSSAFVFGEVVDLSWLGSECLSTMKVIVHRSLPIQAEIKQLALVKNSVGKWFLCVFVNAPDDVFRRNFGSANGASVGIDPGVKTALTTSDGVKITPIGLSRDNILEKRLKRLQRQLDRQTRINNPQCFDTKGRWKRGQKITVRSKGMLQTSRDIAAIKLHFCDAKADFYHNTAIKLLKQYDNIALGNASMHKVILGKGNQKRSINERTREHSIADFKMKLKDKANLSLTSKTIFDTNEAYTSKTCNQCGKMNDNLTLQDRMWKCPHCGVMLDRDINAAINIKNRMLKDLINQ